jgi:hypothetical protein
MRNCEICGKQLRISSIVSHMKIHDEQNKKSIDSQSNQVSTNDTNVNKSKKRASAIRSHFFIIFLINFEFKSEFIFSIHNVLELTTF